MYEKHFGFSEKPFQLNPDPQFYFDSSQHRRAMAFVRYGLHQSEGFIVVTGEVGAGKTTVVRNLLANLDRDRVVGANIATTQLEADDLLRLVAAAFGVRNRDLAKADLLLALEAVLASHAAEGKRSLLVVDEAQNLNKQAVEELRMLSNFQLGTHALLQTFLVGQPEFRRMLEGPDLSQLRQRVIAACHIGPLSAAETRQYVEHRLRLAGWSQRPVVSDGAFAAAHVASGGVPRRINLIFDRTLLSCYLGDHDVITEDMVREVAAEIAAETGSAQASSDPPAEAPKPSVPSATVIEMPPRARRRGENIGPDLEAVWRAALEEIARELRRLQKSMERMERSNQASVALFKRYVDVATSHRTDAQRMP